MFGLVYGFSIGVFNGSDILHRTIIYLSRNLNIVNTNFAMFFSLLSSLVPIKATHIVFDLKF